MYLFLSEHWFLYQVFINSVFFCKLHYKKKGLRRQSNSSGWSITAAAFHVYWQFKTAPVFLFSTFPLSHKTNTRSSKQKQLGIYFQDSHAQLFDVVIRCSSYRSSPSSLSTQVPLSLSLSLSLARARALVVSLYLSIPNYSLVNLMLTSLWWFWVVFDLDSSLVLIFC
jgi:hypothetical protein